MKKEDLYRSINALDDMLIERSEDGIREKMPFNHHGKKQFAKTAKWGIMAAGAICAAALIVLISYGRGAGTIQPSDSFVRWEEPSQVRAFDDTPVLYSTLQLNDNTVNEEIIKKFTGAAAADIVGFDESMLANCGGIVEGEITNIYLKEYSYQIFDNKFEDNGVLNARAQTVVYEIKVDKVWYGENFESKTLLIEDQMLFPEEMFVLKKGHRYVIPFYNAGGEIYSGLHYAGGDIKRDSVYSSIYQFHPQIEVTNDNCYILSNDWKKLSSKEARRIIIDSGDSAEESFYKDKMVLVTPEVFEEQINSLISVYCN